MCEGVTAEVFRLLTVLVEDEGAVLFRGYGAGGGRHTSLRGDWSADVYFEDVAAEVAKLLTVRVEDEGPALVKGDAARSAERRGGKVCRSRWSPYH